LPYGLLADVLVALHVAFIAFALLGALLVARWPRIAWLHLPAIAWAVLVEVNSWVCPLTPWEQELRAAAGQGGYRGGFVEHYVLPVLYPAGLTAYVQWVLALVVVVVNAVLYFRVLHRARHRNGSSP
jgi:hypothetical protein